MDIQADEQVLAAQRAQVATAEEVTDGAYSFGVEEEYFLVDADGQAASQTPEGLFRQAFAVSDGRIGREFLQAQAEADTRPCVTVGRLRAELRFVRAVLQVVAARHGLAILACGTHPTAPWRQSVQSGKPRYDAIMAELQMIGRRNMFCGMHVHVQLPDPSRRVEVMGRMVPYLPLFLALSTSSPFWQAQPTGSASYRSAAYSEMPRSGIPDLFRSDAEYQDYVAAMVRAGAIKDARHIWWLIRPSARYPTLELRVSDCCTRVDDTVAIASLYRVLARRLYLDPACGGGQNAVSRAFAEENKWLAQRHGVHATFVTDAGAVPVADLVEQAIALTAEDAEILGCADEVAHCRTIVTQGTSADAQLEIFHASTDAVGSEGAFAPVIDWVRRTTVGSD